MSHTEILIQTIDRLTKMEKDFKQLCIEVVKTYDIEYRAEQDKKLEELNDSAVKYLNDEDYFVE